MEKDERVLPEDVTGVLCSCERCLCVDLHTFDTDSERRIIQHACSRTRHIAVNKATNSHTHTTDHVTSGIRCVLRYISPTPNIKAHTYDSLGYNKLSVIYTLVCVSVDNSNIYKTHTHNSTIGFECTQPAAEARMGSIIPLLSILTKHRLLSANTWSANRLSCLICVSYA